MPTSAEVEALLTGPGGAFEVATEEVRGIPMKVFKQRMKRLRELTNIARMRGDETFLVFGDERMSFAEFVDASDRVSAALLEHGVGHGDRVAVLSANNPEWCTAFWGAVDIGAILVGLNGWWKTDEILYGLEDSGAKVLIADRARFERIADELPNIKTLEAVFLIDVDGPAAAFGDDSRLHRFEDLLQKPGSGPPTVEIDEDDPAVIFYTSGTTGRPKGAISTHRSMISNLMGTMYSSVSGGMITPGAVTISPATPTASLLPSPLFHVAGCHSGLVVGLI